ncbi:MAG: exodeoxyribonuclease large subunit, partial [Bacteroidota bacterium]
MALTLSQLANSIKRMFDHHFGDRTFWVVGEINSYKNYGATRHFFDLIEKDADSDQVLTRFSSVIWANAADSVRRFESVTGRTLANGLEVLVKVRVTYTVQYGLKLTVEELDASFTLGQMERKRRETLTKLLVKHPNLVRLVDNQYITKNKGLITAPVIQRIAVITSKEAAGFEDFVHSLVANRFGYSWQLNYFFSRVQGQEAAYSIARRIAEINLKSELYDVIVIVRGGGAQTDLFVFDDFLLNRWIAASEVPVWVGIGHMRDQTIADLFSHRSFKTPTAVAEEIVHHNRMFEQQVGLLTQQTIERARGLIANEAVYINKLGFHLRARIPERVHSEQTRLTRSVHTLTQAVFSKLADEKHGIQVQTYGRLSRALHEQVQQQRQYLMANKSALR